MSSPLHITSLTFEHHPPSTSTLGISEPRPRLSWRFGGEVPDWAQSSYDVEILPDGAAAPEIYSVTSSENILVPWPGDALKNAQAASVRVRAHGAQGISTEWSARCTVETGLVDVREWVCELIEPRIDVEVAEGPKRPLLFRREFAVEADQRVMKARLHITAHGVYEAEVNGARVGDHVLAPGWSSYAHRLSYQSFDVTDTIREGGNVLGVHVAEGWFMGRLGFAGGKRNIWGERLGVMCQLVISMHDGKEVRVLSDGDWKYSQGPIVASELYDGEVYDANQEREGWSRPGYDDMAWSPVTARPIPDPAILKAPSGPPVRQTEVLPAVDVSISPSGRTIVDFGQNLVGVVRMRLPPGPKGHNITLTHTEVLEKGECATRPLRHAKATDTVILSGRGSTEWSPKFTFHGFRYVQVANWPKEHPIELDDFSAVVLHTDMEKTGWFECSDKLLNKLHENIVWGMRGNFLSVPTDCPQRDERLGWTGDIQAFARTANFLYDTAGMLGDWLGDLAAEQMQCGGIPPLVCPNVLGDLIGAQPVALWGDCVVTLPWDLYLAYGDKSILQAQYSSMKAWIDSAIPRQANGLWDDSTTYQLGDWLDPLAPADEPGNGRTDPELVANAFLIHATSVLADISSVLGFPDASSTYHSSVTSLKSAFSDEYVTRNGRLVSDSQTSLALAIYFSLLAPSQEKTAATRLAHLIRSTSRFKIATGFAGTPILGHALTKTGNTQLFYRMLLHRKCPSWLYPVTMGATTVWERWDSMLPDGSVNPGEMTSFNHYALGSVADWMHRVIGGVWPLEPGWREIAVEPVPGGNLTSANVRFLSPCGMVEVGWSIDEEDIFRLDVLLPGNTTGRLRLPGAEGTERLGSGRHQFCVPYVRPEWPPLPVYPPFFPHDDDEP